MPLIDVTHARAGMILTADVRDRRGRVLIPEGKELKERYLAALPMWGITQIEVEGSEEIVANDTPAEEWAIAQANEDLAGRFRNANRTHPAIEALFAVCVQRRAEDLSRKQSA